MLHGQLWVKHGYTADDTAYPPLFPAAKVPTNARSISSNQVKAHARRAHVDAEAPARPKNDKMPDFRRVKGFPALKKSC